MTKNSFSHKKTNVLAMRLLFYILLCSSLFTLLVTSVQLYLDYRRDVNLIDERFYRIKKTYLQTISTSLWHVDEEQLKIQMRGILQFPDIIYVEVFTDEGQRFSAGNHGQSPNTIFHEFPIESHDEDEGFLGTLLLVATLDEVYKRMAERILIILTSQTLKTFFVSICILFIVQYLITRYLSDMASHVQELDPNNLNRPLSLKRKIHGKNQTDELTVLETTFNNMIMRLNQTKEQWNSLRRFSDHLIDFEDTTQIFRFAFLELCNNMSLSDAVLYFDVHEERLIQSEMYRDGFLKKTLAVEWMDHLFTESTEQVAVFNTVSSNSPVMMLYADQPDARIEGGHCVFARADSLNQHVLFLFRHSEEPPFDSNEIEFIKSFINASQTAQQAIKTIREKARMQGELKTAAAVQKALFPRIIPNVKNLEISTFFQSAAETGGDWYGFVAQRENYLFFLIGDVTGHGTPAALVTATACATCRMIERIYEQEYDPPSPTEILNHLNKAIFEAGAPDYLMTFFVARLDLNTGWLSYSNAGHNFPILLQADGRIGHLVNANNPLGFEPDSQFTEDSKQLKKGDILFLYTDGLTENENPEGQMWSERNLRRFLKRNSHLPLEEMVNQLVKNMFTFLDGRPLLDDTSILACKVTESFTFLNKS